jgi:hypothetical protein
MYSDEDISDEEMQSQFLKQFGLQLNDQPIAKKSEPTTWNDKGKDAYYSRPVYGSASTSQTPYPSPSNAPTITMATSPVSVKAPAPTITMAPSPVSVKAPAPTITTKAPVPRPTITKTPTIAPKLVTTKSISPRPSSPVATKKTPPPPLVATKPAKKSARMAVNKELDALDDDLPISSLKATVRPLTPASLLALLDRPPQV